MSVTIRRAEQADAAALAAVAAVTFPLACPPHTTEEAKAHFIATVLSAQRFHEYIADAGRRVIVAEEGTPDEVTGGDATPDGPLASLSAIGYAMLVLAEPTDAEVVAALSIRPSCELSKCYLLPGHHGAGAAGALMATALDAARAAGAAGMWLGVNQENARAQRFYAKHGFVPVGTKHFTLGDRLEDDYVFERAL